MCQLTYTALNDRKLNQRLSLLLTSTGSLVHKDGTGYIGGCLYYKSSLPAAWIGDSGAILDKIVEDDSPLIAHIRQASALVPVNNDNAHPFYVKSKSGHLIYQVHNGTLTPRKKAEHVTEMEIEVEEEDSKTKKKRKVKKNVKRSDSLVFLERLLKEYDKNPKLDSALTETMKEFTGKFAFIYRVVDNKSTKDYIVKGRTANLYMNFQLDAPDGKVIGYAINTDKELLDNSCTLLSNLNQLEGGKPLYFSYPEELKDEKIYEADKNGLVEIGEIKESYESTTTYYYPTNQRTSLYEEGDDFFTGRGTGTPGTSNDLLPAHERAFRKIHKFMKTYLLSTRDINFLFLVYYGSSVSELDAVILNNFVRKVIPRLEQKTSKKAARYLGQALDTSFFSLMLYRKYDLSYPWMFNSKKRIQTLIEELRKEKDKK